MPPDKRRAPPAGYGGAPQKIIALGSGDILEHSLDISVSQLVPRPVRTDEIPELRAIYWRLARLGLRLPAELGVIVIEGGTT